MDLELPRLLIADATEEFCMALVDFVRDFYEIRTCREGNEALQVIRSFRPHILVLDLMMPGLDGITLLQRAAQEGHTPMVLATTRFQSDYVLETLARLGVDYLMVKPCEIKAVAARVKDLSGHLKPMEVEKPDPRTQVSNTMLKLSFSTKLHGYSYLREAIVETVMHPGQMVTKELYPTIAAMNHGSTDQVERSIRSAITKAWAAGDETVWRRFFLPEADGRVRRPTNAAFITRIADYIRTGAAEFD